MCACIKHEQIENQTSMGQKPRYKSRNKHVPSRIDTTAYGQFNTKKKKRIETSLYID